MPSLSLFKLYQFEDRLPADWGVVQCPGVIVRKRCEDIVDVKLLEPLRELLPGSIEEMQILDRLFAPLKDDGSGWTVEVRNHLALRQWIGDEASYEVMIAAKQQARGFARGLSSLSGQVFQTRDQALHALQSIIQLSSYIPSSQLG